MSELINNTGNRKELLKHMILQLHEGVAPDEVKNRLMKVLKDIRYDVVVEVEQELISEGLPVEEVLRLCDIHTYVLEGNIVDEDNVQVPAGHPVHTFRMENRALEMVLRNLDAKLNQATMGMAIVNETYKYEVLSLLNQLSDVDKHYRRKENLLFPFLEKKGITGPPTVMWGKHDETRALLKEATQWIARCIPLAQNHMAELGSKTRAVMAAVEGMIQKEEEILLPMCLDNLTTDDWYQIYTQTTEIGYCLYDPQVEWKPSDVDTAQEDIFASKNLVKLPTGLLSATQLEAILNSLPIDMTFVDKDDKVAYFSQSPERIFDRNRAILQRDVRQCHPPHSVHIVEQILQDFKSGKESRAPFWIQMGPKFVYIEYIALRDAEGNYMGTLEVSQELSGKRALTGEQRLLSYDK